MTTEEAIDMLECLIVEAKLGIDSIKNLPMVETQNHLPSNMMILGDFIIIRHRDDRTLNQFSSASTVEEAVK